MLPLFLFKLQGLLENDSQLYHVNIITTKLYKHENGRYFFNGQE